MRPQKLRLFGVTSYGEALFYVKCRNILINFTERLELY